MTTMGDDRRGLVDALVGDGRPLLKLTGIALIGSGLFAFFLGATGHFLPHDTDFLGVPADALYLIAEGRLAHFMIHDRVSFGGAILGVGVLYLWLAEFPLRAGEAWAWWALLVSGAMGFASFMAYLGYGYLDSWHGVATLVLLPMFGVGMVRSIRLLPRERSARTLLRPGWRGDWRTRYGVGRALLLVTSLCLVLGGTIIMTVGMSSVFVPQDLEFMQLCVGDIDAFNPRLVPLIAHDRAGFGGGVCCCGLTMFFCLWCSGPSRSLWQALAIVGVAGFGTAIGVHYPIGYTSATHLAPAYFGAAMFVVGMTLTRRKCSLSAKKFERVFRDRLLTPEEASQDAGVRREVESEFPPARASEKKTATVGVSAALLSEGLKRAICDSSRSIDEIAQEAGVSPELISEFVSGARDIRMGTADALADVLGLNLVGS